MIIFDPKLSALPPLRPCLEELQFGKAIWKKPGKEYEENVWLRQCLAEDSGLMEHLNLHLTENALRPLQRWRGMRLWFNAILNRANPFFNKWKKKNREIDRCFQRLACLYLFKSWFFFSHSRFFGILSVFEFWIFPNPRFFRILGFFRSLEFFNPGFFNTVFSNPANRFLLSCFLPITCSILLLAATAYISHASIKNTDVVPPWRQRQYWWYQRLSTDRS